MHRHRYLLFGPQGSGKGTQAAFLAQRLGIPHLSVGDILRHEIAARTPFGQRIATVVASGRLAPPTLVNTVVAHRLRKQDARRGYLLDGYPRSHTQLSFYERAFPGSIALLLHITDQEAVRRIQSRRVCPHCGAIYHLTYKRPKYDMACDVCGTPIVKRHDDYPAAIKKRLKLYHSHTEPLVHYYRSRGRLISVDGSPSIPVVRRALVRAIDRLGK